MTAVILSFIAGAIAGALGIILAVIAFSDKADKRPKRWWEE